MSVRSRLHACRSLSQGALSRKTSSCAHPPSGLTLVQVYGSLARGMMIWSCGSLIPEATGLVTTVRRCDSGVTRYPDGGGLTAAGGAAGEQVRLAAELIGLYRKETR